MFLRRTKSLSVAVLGCGPAALFAVHAFTTLGYERVSILSKKRRSEMFGAQYLHEPILGLSSEEGIQITYSLRGTPEAYAQKVYGDKVDPSMTSPARLPQHQVAYDIRAAYYTAWGMYSPLITGINIQPAMVPDIKRSFDLVVSTIPAQQLCADMLGAHKFEVQKVWAIGDAPERGIFCPITVPPDSVVCNGDPNPHWYRASNVFGYKTAEWPDGDRPPVDDVAMIGKPIGTNCDCWLDKQYMRLGRYGTWTKGVLSHEGYVEIMERY